MNEMIKVEFLLPTKYNDGGDVERKKFLEVRKIIVRLFGGVTTHPVSKGIWISPL